MRVLGAACCLLLSACAGKSIPSVVLPGESEVTDPFVLELVQEHSAAAQKAPEDAALRGRLGMVYEANHIWSLAARAFDNAAILDPETPVWAYHAALAYYNTGESAEADRLIETLVARYPQFAPGLYRHGLLLIQRGEAAAAQAELERCTQLAPKFVESRIAEAEALVMLDKPTLALGKIEKALTIQPTCLRAYYVRGLALQALGRNEEAGEAFKRGADNILTLMPDSLSSVVRQYATGVSIKVTYANELLAVGRLQEALKVIEDGLEKRPSDQLLLVVKAIVYRRLKQPEQAIAILVALHADEPKHVKCLTVLAGAYFDLKDLSNSLLAADKAVRLLPEHGRAHLLRGRALVGLNRMEEARAALEKTILLDPELATAYIHLAESYTALARYAEAEAMWKTALERTPRYTLGWLELGLLQLRLLKVTEARQTLEGLRALGLDSVSSRDAEQRLAKALFDLTGE